MAMNWCESSSDYYGAQNKLLSQQLEVLTKQLQQFCQNNSIQVSHLVYEFCEGGHPKEHCGTFGYGEQNQVNYMGYSHGINFYPQANTYYPNLINNPISFNKNSPQFTHQPYFY